MLVNMSQKSAREDALSHGGGIIALRAVFDWSGITAAHLRSTYFAEWLLYLAPCSRRSAAVHSATGRHAPIAAETRPV